MTPEELELITVEIVAYAGDARSKYVEALNYANEGNFGEAEKLIEEASELINEQDHLMTVMLLRDIVKNFVNLAKKIG